MTRTYSFPRNAVAIRTRHAEYVRAQLVALPIDKDWQVDIRPAKRDRTPPQNRYMHGLIGEIAKAIGMTADDAKDALVLKFLGVDEEKQIGGVTIIKRVSTAKLGTKQCAEFCDDLRQWAATFLGMVLPLPEEYQ